MPSPEDLPYDIAALSGSSPRWRVMRRRREPRPPGSRSSWHAIGVPSAARPRSSSRARPNSLELAIETLETDQAERLAPAAPEATAIVDSVTEAQKPGRRQLPALRRRVAAHRRRRDRDPVVRHIREKLSCRGVRHRRCRSGARSCHHNLFAGSDAGGHRAAAMYSLIETANSTASTGR